MYLLYVIRQHFCGSLYNNQMTVTVTRLKKNIYLFEQESIKTKQSIICSLLLKYNNTN